MISPESPCHVLYGRTGRRSDFIGRLLLHGQDSHRNGQGKEDAPDVDWIGLKKPEPFRLFKESSIWKPLTITNKSWRRSSLSGGSKRRNVRARPSNLRRMRSGSQLQARGQGRRKEHNLYRSNRLYVCGQFQLSLHALRRVLDSCPDHQRRRCGLRNRSGLQDTYRAGKIRRPVPQHYRDGRRRRHARYRFASHVGHDVSRATMSFSSATTMNRTPIPVFRRLRLPLTGPRPPLPLRARKFPEGKTLFPKIPRNWLSEGLRR